MIKSFRDAGTEDIFHGRETRAARRSCPEAIWSVARRKLTQLNVATRLLDLQTFPGNHLHELKRDRAGQHAIRINDQYRVCFRWTSGGPEGVEITDYH